MKEKIRSFILRLFGGWSGPLSVLILYFSTYNKKWYKKYYMKFYGYKYDIFDNDGERKA